MPITTSASEQHLTSLISVVDNLTIWDQHTAICQMTASGSVDYSYQEMAVLIKRLAVGLIEQGIQSGDAIALYAPNSFEWFVAALAILRAGAVIVPIDIQAPRDALEHILKDGDVKIAFTTKTLKEKLESLNIPRIYCLDDSGDQGEWKSLISNRDGLLPEVHSDCQAILFYTSGTTGMPKGVPLTHGKLVHSLNALFDLNIVKAGDRLLVPLPLHHVYPLVMGVLYALNLGLKVILPQELTGPAIARALKDGDATTMIGVPRLYSAMVSGILARAKSEGGLKSLLFSGLYGLSYFLRRRMGLHLGKRLLKPLHQQLGPNLEILACGGSKLDAHLAWSLEALGWKVAIGYGLTETAPLLSYTFPGDGNLSSVGTPAPEVNIRIDKRKYRTYQDETKGIMPGEVLAKGPNIFDGYHKLPEATAKAFTSDGWFRTGDLGFFDNKGLLHILGRASSTIVTSGGENIQPEDIEDLYQQHPVIDEMGILLHEEKLVALIVPNAEALQEAGDGDPGWNVRRALVEQSNALATYKRVTDFALTRAPLPRTRLGKLRRHLLLQPYLDAKSGIKLQGKPASKEDLSPEDQARLADPSVLDGWNWLCERFADKNLTFDTSPQLELGIDSLEWLNITMEIRERTGLELGQEVYAEIDTVRDLLDAISKASAADDDFEALPFDRPLEQLTPLQLYWFQPLDPIPKVGRQLLNVVNQAGMRFFFSLKVRGAQRLPLDTQFILCPNHVSYLDPFAISAALPASHLEQLYWCGWHRVVMRSSINRCITRLGHTIPIDPHKGALSSLAVGAAILDSGRNLGWFPEGRRSPEGTLQTFKPGIGHLAHHFNTLIIPVNISGAYEAYPPSAALPSLSPITVTFGYPVLPETLASEGNAATAPERITLALYQRLLKLSEETS